MGTVKESGWVIRCDFPDEDQFCYVLRENMLGTNIYVFDTKEAAEAYAHDNLDCRYAVVKYSDS